MGKYFTIGELCESSTAKQNGLKNLPNKAEVANMELLIQNVLDPLREAYGKPIKVNSGFRNATLNAMVGGVPTSEHRRGMAADIAGSNKDENKKIFDLAQKLNLPYRQLINEKNYSWIHVSYNRYDEKRQVLNLP